MKCCDGIATGQNLSLKSLPSYRDCLESGELLALYFSIGVVGLCQISGVQALQILCVCVRVDKARIKPKKAKSV